MRLEDEVAAEAIKEASRAYVEDVLQKGIASTKKRTRVRDHSEAVRVRPLTPTCSRSPNELRLREGLCAFAYMRGLWVTHGRGCCHMADARCKQCECGLCISTQAEPDTG